MRKIFFTLFILSGAILMQAQTGENPFAKYGFKKVRTYTSSKGEFEEFHDNKDVVEIGSVLYDTKTSQVVGYAKEESENEVAAATPAMSIDPLCEKYYWISPYAYCMNNPVRFIDPNGMDVYRYDDKRGEFHLAVKNDDTIDQVGKFKYDKKTGEYNLQTNKKGEAKTRIDNIEKGILSDGINFKEKDNVIAVGEEGQATVGGVENFVVELSEMVDKEIGGYEYSMKGQNEISNVYINKYKNNTDQKAHTGFNVRVAGVTPNQIDIHVDFHTHLSKFPEIDRLRPSGLYTPGGDMEYKRNQEKHGIKKFIILTRGFTPIPY